MKVSWQDTTSGSYNKTFQKIPDVFISQSGSIWFLINYISCYQSLIWSVATFGAGKETAWKAIYWTLSLSGLSKSSIGKVPRATVAHMRVLGIEGMPQKVQMKDQCKLITNKSNYHPQLLLNVQVMRKSNGIPQQLSKIVNYNKQSLLFHTFHLKQHQEMALNASHLPFCVSIDWILFTSVQLSAYRECACNEDRFVHWGFSLMPWLNMKSSPTNRTAVSKSHSVICQNYNIHKLIVQYLSFHYISRLC